MKRRTQGAMTRSILALSAATMLAACGSSSDPDAITIDELKSPTSLDLIDMGNGSVKLVWTGSNNEDDFDGYNLYGMKVSDAFTAAMTAAGASEGTAIQLLDAEGEKNAKAVTLMEQFSYNGENFETPATKSAEAGEDAEFFPIYTGKDEKGAPLLPSCRPAAGAKSACANITAGNQETLNAFNGQASYELTGLVVGAEYCFAVFSSQDKGEEISATSSPVRCITPRAQTTIEVAEASPLVPAPGNKSMRVDVVAARTACTDADSATACTVTVTPDTVFCSGADDETAFCFEFQDSTVGITSGAHTVVQDAGYAEGGFDSLDLPVIPGITTLDGVKNENGYNIKGQTIALFENHIYIVAVGNADENSFHYDYFYVDAVDHAAGTLSVTYRMSKDAGL